MSSNSHAEPKLKSINASGIELAYFEWGELNTNLPSLFMVHATGFHARLWDDVIEKLPSNRHVIALEQRGHGRSEKVGADHWSTYGDDQATFLRALGLDNLIGVGHSMGAHGLVDAAAKTKCFKSLLLLDPTIASPDTYAEFDGAQIDFSQLHPAAKRRNSYASAQQMYDQLKQKSSFPLFDSRILHDYCRYGLLPDGAGAFQLACPPEIEARVYMTSRTNAGIYDSVRGLTIPVHIIRAKLPKADNLQDFSSSPTYPKLVDEFPNATEEHLADCSHFIPMQRPDLVVAHLTR